MHVLFSVAYFFLSCPFDLSFVNFLHRLRRQIQVVLFSTSAMLEVVALHRRTWFSLCCSSCI